MKKGFTLVELSIVLVIVGLLIGGVLVGQSLIDSARVNAFIKQMAEVKIAAQQFVVKYKKPPGDSKQLANGGDGDGIVESSDMQAGTLPGSYQHYDYEVANSWSQLWQSGFMQSQHSQWSNNVSSGLSVSKNNFPAAKMGKGKEPAGLAMYGALDSLHLWIVDFSLTTSSYIETETRYCSFTPSEAMAIDAKLDDGLGTSTAESGVGFYCKNENGTNDNNNDCYDSITNKFKVNLTTKECYLSYRILAY